MCLTVRQKVKCQEAAGLAPAVPAITMLPDLCSLPSLLCSIVSPAVKWRCKVPQGVSWGREEYCKTAKFLAECFPPECGNEQLNVNVSEDETNKKELKSWG